jgi:hypothetical protein
MNFYDNLSFIWNVLQIRILIWNLAMAIRPLFAPEVNPSFTSIGS